MQRDNLGNTIVTPTNQPATSETPIKIIGSYGEETPGKLIGGVGVPDKKN